MPTSAASPSRPRSSAPASRPTRSQYVIMGQVLQAGAGQITGPPGRGQGRHPDERPGADDQQGLPVRPGRDRAGRPADPRRRVRHHRRRRHGVDDQRAAPAAEVARRATSTATIEMLDSMAYDGLDRRLRQHRRWASRPTTYNAKLGIDPRGAGRVRRPLAPARRRGARRTALFDDEIAPVDDPAAQGRPDRVHARTRASGPTPPPSRSAKLRPAFAKDGTITAGSSSQISDGAPPSS